VPDLPSRLDLYESGRRVFIGRARRIEPTIVDVAGSDANLFVGSTSYMAHAVLRSHAEGLANVFSDSCDDDEKLDRLFFDRYREVRKGASAAVVPVVLTRATADAGAGSIAIGRKFSTATGVDYYATTPAVFGSGDLVATCNAKATQAGKEFQVGRHAITGFSDRSGLFDTTITVDNPDPAAGGEPRESNDQFKARMEHFWESARRGTLTAIEYASTLVPGVDSAHAFTATTAEGYPGRAVIDYIADSSGVSNSALIDLVRVQLDEWAAAGIYVAVVTGQPEIPDLVLRLSFQGNVDTRSIAEQVRGAMVGFVNSLGVDQPILHGELMAVLTRFKAVGLLATNDTLVAPAGDLYPEPGHTFRLRAENVGLTY
jgi:hypothetical protein